ncbi:nucleotidyl transferase AbiEii/AbiGii toxin family protein [Shewanella sp. 202IG2-18]|uniref:nucleotidyl transferase AbiEii/AbiGii toxin family protein n=1 Tax=Parashewanella hymeniacidonis TaxID=2807618 RepID=UPI001961C658|nr:nucleotidyl transferase AbiEii/AbiGii toxin family protein [Parashewanella hymeniacidonis]MBM7074530.1 nucleotidyl transferase AbiEii/AbiGii toxin family protein [Parashewanella hymeniacidonis]
MLKKYISQVLANKPELAGVVPVIEKELLHHDIMRVLLEQGALQKLIFTGGTSLRLCYNSSRLSEDLDFNAGLDFKPEQFDGLEFEIQQFLTRKYEVDVFVNKPSEASQGNTSSWKISIERESGRPDIPRQKMHIDVCAIPSFGVQKRPLINHYGIDVPTQGYLVPVQSLEEIMADKFVALAYRSRRIKPRDIWDIVWLKQQGINSFHELTLQKLTAREKSVDDFKSRLETQVQRLTSDSEVKADFNQEMSRFIPAQIKARTLENPDYWPYLQTEITEQGDQLIKKLGRSSQQFNFDMSL